MFFLLFFLNHPTLSLSVMVLSYAERWRYTCCAVVVCAVDAGWLASNPYDKSVGGSRNGLRLLSRTALASAGRFRWPACQPPTRVEFLSQVVSDRGVHQAVARCGRIAAALGLACFCLRAASIFSGYHSLDCIIEHSTSPD